MPTLEDERVKREDEIDKRADEMFNSHPDLKGDEMAAGKANADSQSFDDIAKNYDKSADPSQENTNIARARELDAGWSTNVSNNESDKPRRRGLLRKFGPSGGILGLLFGGVFGIGVFLTPSLALVHMKEVFTEDLNDQLAAMDIRTTHVFKSKLKDLGKRNSTCTLVKIRCGLRGMSDKQLRAFAKAGIDIDVGEKNSVTRKTAVYAMTFTKSDGTRVTIRGPSELRRQLGDSNIRNQLRRAYNPKWYGLWDSTAGKVFSKFGTGKGSRLNGSTDEERNQSVSDNVSGEESDLNPPDQSPVQDEDGDGDTTEERERANREREKAENRIREITGSESTKSVLGSGLKSSLKGIGALGVVDTACTVYNTARAVEAGAKVIRARQLVAYSMIYLNTADKIKAGTATPEEVEYLGKKLSKIDTEATVTDETNAKDIANPNLNKSAYDSQGARAAFYNDAPTLDARAAQYTVGGGLVGKLASVNNTVTKYLGGSRESIRDKCGIVQNPFVRGGSAIVGIIAGIGSGGGTLAVSVAASVALGLAMPILTAYLKDMIAGETVGPDTETVDAGNAVFSGAAVLMGDMAMQRGMQPASKEQLGTYQEARTQIKNEYIAMETEDAKDTPFDIMNQYSFIGSLARKLLPSYTAASSTSAAISSGLPKFFSSASSSLLSNARAVGDFNPERFEKCEDEGYDELGLDADIFCNVRYALSPTELAMDTDENYDWMVSQGHVDGDTGDPASDTYKDFLKNCTSTGGEDGEGARIAGWGSTIEENGDIGKNCIDGKSGVATSTLQHFRVYTMDRSIEEGMDNGPEVQSGNDSPINDNSGGDFTIASFNILHTGPDPHERIWRERMGRSLQTLKSNGVQVAGLQEVRPAQNKLLQNSQVNDTYGIWPTDTNGGEGYSPNPIIWDTDKFDMVRGSGELLGIEYEGEIKRHMVLIKLKDNETGQEMYVVSTHDPGPVKRGGSPAVRARNAQKYKQLYAERADDGIPMFLVGDFNSNNDGYCVMTGEDSKLINIYDASQNPRKNGSCPSKNDVLIDHIYLTKDDSITVPRNSIKRIEKEYNGNGSRAGGNNGSDHPTMIASISIGGDDGGGGGRVDGDDYARECGQYLSSGDCTGECVGFVKFRLVKHGVIQNMSLGNGGAVTSTLGRLGFRVNTTPAVHSVMSLRHNSVGHTAMVSKVNADGSIVVEEYNWPGGHIYGKRTISAATLNSYRSQGIISFAHTETEYE